MIKRIKKYLLLQKLLYIEVLETLATICIYLEHEGRRARNPYAEYMRDHFETLKFYSDDLRHERDTKAEDA